MSKAPYAVGTRANHAECCGVEWTKCGAGATPDADQHPHDRGASDEAGGDAALQRRGRAQERVRGARCGRGCEQGLGHASKGIASERSAVVALRTTAQGRSDERVCLDRQTRSNSLMS